MERKTAADFDPEVLILFDAYVHGALDRRGFLDKAAKYAVGGVTAAMLLEQLNPKFAEAQQVAKDDARLKARVRRVPARRRATGKMRGYLVRPAKAAGKLPGVLVVHENRGLNPHIEDIARRLALDNFIAFAPDALTPLGGYPAGGEDEARELFGKLDQPKTREDFVAAAGFLQQPRRVHGRHRRGGLLLRRRHRQHAGHARARTAAPRCRSTAARRPPRTSRRSRRRCSSTTPGTTSASTPAGPPTRRRSRPPA